jgi:hypothetical protein
MTIKSQLDEHACGRHQVVLQRPQRRVRLAVTSRLKSFGLLLVAAALLGLGLAAPWQGSLGWRADGW